MRNTSAFQPSPSTKVYYLLNGNANDVSGQNNTGTPTDITYPQGRFGQAARFNGTTSKVACGDTPFDWIEYNTPFTISAWIRHEFTSSGASGEVNSIIAKQLDINNPGFTWGMTRRNGSELNLDLQIIGSYGADNEYFIIRSVDMLPYRLKWTHVTVTYSGSQNRSGVQMFVNGISKPLSNVYESNACNVSIQNSENLIIGWQTPDGVNVFKGLIDEVIIESRAWTAKEVETYYRKSMLNYQQKTFGQIVYAYISELLKGSYTLTGKNVNTLRNYVSSLLKGAYAVTGKQLTANKAYIARLLKGAYSLVGKALKVPTTWINRTKNSASWTNSTKNSSSWTNRTKN